MNKTLKEISNNLGIEFVGIAGIGPYLDLEKRIIGQRDRGYYTTFEDEDISKRVDPRVTMGDARSIIVCLFPYFIGNKEDSNISKYTYAIDYHLSAKEILDKIGESLKEKIEGFKYQAYVDTGPLVDRYLAYSAGLGFYGINSHIINEKYGSYFFIGYILNNYPFEEDKPLDRTCIQCFRCVKECPGQVILGDFNINPLNCRSYLTQKKGELTPKEKNIIRKTNMVFGCDVCQDVCPHNKKVSITPLEDFKTDTIFKIDYDEVINMSNKGFKRKYGNRAFSWRGRKIIVRNFDIINKKIILKE